MKIENGKEFMSMKNKQCTRLDKEFSARICKLDRIKKLDNAISQVG